MTNGQTNIFNDKAKDEPKIVWADNQFELDSLTETVARINESTGANTVVKLRQPEYKPGSWGC